MKPARASRRNEDRECGEATVDIKVPNNQRIRTIEQRRCSGNELQVKTRCCGRLFKRLLATKREGLRELQD